MRGAILAVLLAACGGSGVREAHPPSPTPETPPPPMGAEQVCIGATGLTEYDVPKGLCPARVEMSCDCGGALFYSFCEDPYYYDFYQRTWLTLCPPK